MHNGKIDNLHIFCYGELKHAFSFYHKNVFAIVNSDAFENSPVAAT